MKLVRAALWSANAALSRQFQNPNFARSFSASALPVTENRLNLNSSESSDDFEQRIFSQGSHQSSSMGTLQSSSAFYSKLDKAEKAYDQSRMGFSFNTGNRSNFMGGLDDNTLTDGMDDMLKRAASYFEFDPEEVSKENYAFRPDVNLLPGMTYDTKDLDVRKPGARKPPRRGEFVTTTEEVLLQADFRNVKFLANFITEAGVLIKRSKTGISAKAQRKVAREIKTARAFGLMPFTTMGTKHFVYGATMEDEDRDFEFEASYDRNFVNEDPEDA